MLNVITFGSATWDIFIRDRELYSKKNSRIFTGKGVYFPLGAKIDIDEIRFFSGGGGTNTAASFLSQGFKSAYCGMVGEDPAGDRISGEMKRRGDDLSLLVKTGKKPTNHSFIISIPKKDRTILTYRGASDLLSFKNIPQRKLKAKWFYIAPLSRISLFESLVNFAYKKGIKIAVNPGYSQLRVPFGRLEKILRKTDILFLNQEESSFLTGLSYRKEREIFKKVSEFYPGIFVMTKGPRGVAVADGANIYRAGVLKSKVIDRTGTGDSFGAGFTSGIMAGKGIEYAIQLGSANATACLSQWGAKNGLLAKGKSFKKVKVEKY